MKQYNSDFLLEFLLPDESEFLNNPDDAFPIFSVFVRWAVHGYHVDDEIPNESAMQL